MHISPTLVEFPQGITESTSTVLKSWHDSSLGKYLFITDVSPFHPSDHVWPDQPADYGQVVSSGNTYQISNSLTGAFSPEQEFFLDSDIPVKRGEEGWSFVVVHVCENKVDCHSSVRLIVNNDRRLKLSKAHSSCHLAALALNKALHSFWSKETRTDSLGNFDFDSLAIQKSHVGLQESVDIYRLGKSLRKKGLSAVDVESNLASIEDTCNSIVNEWVSTDCPIEIICPDKHLDSKRLWQCALPNGVASIPCGGTHVNNTLQLLGLRVNLSFENQALTMTTSVVD